MADTVKTSKSLQLVMEFYDSDDRTFTLDNPKATVTAAQINAIGTYAKNNNCFTGDKDGAAFERFKSAKKITNVCTIYDLS